MPKPASKKSVSTKSTTLKSTASSNADSTKHSPLHVALTVLRFLSTNQSISSTMLIEQLAAREIVLTDRSMQRMMVSLKKYLGDQLDVNISSKPYSYRLKSKVDSFSASTLDLHESLLLEITKQKLNQFLPPVLVDAMHGFFEQAAANFRSTDQNNKDKQWLGKVEIVSETQPLLPVEIDPTLFKEVSQALYHNRYLDITYQNHNDAISEHRVMPLGLGMQGARLYLVCRFEQYAQKEEQRLLAIHRILTAKMSTFEFIRPPNFNLKDYIHQGAFGFGDGKLITLKFKIQKNAGKHLTETKLSHDQEMTLEGDFYRVQATVIDSKRLDWWLNSFGDAVCDVEKLNKPSAN